jgi:hypothetical protein
MEIITKENRFNNAVAALVKGFFNETLAKGTCTACAVGNIVAHSNNIKIVEDEFMFDVEQDEIGITSSWSNIFCSEFNFTLGEIKQNVYPENYQGISKISVDSTGYTWQELALIEIAFEKATKIIWTGYCFKNKKEVLEDQYNGLMAVIDVLCEIEGVPSKEYKNMFSYKIEQDTLLHLN